MSAIEKLSGNPISLESRDVNELVIKLETLTPKQQKAFALFTRTNILSPLQQKALLKVNPAWAFANLGEITSSVQDHIVEKVPKLRVALYKYAGNYSDISTKLGTAMLRSTKVTPKMVGPVLNKLKNLTLRGRLMEKHPSSVRYSPEKVKVSKELRDEFLEENARYSPYLVVSKVPVKPAKPMKPTFEEVENTTVAAKPVKPTKPAKEEKAVEKVAKPAKEEKAVEKVAKPAKEEKAVEKVAKPAKAVAEKPTKPAKEEKAVKPVAAKPAKEDKAVAEKPVKPAKPAKEEKKSPFEVSPAKPVAKSEKTPIKPSRIVVPVEDDDKIEIDEEWIDKVISDASLKPKSTKPKSTKSTEPQESEEEEEDGEGADDAEGEESEEDLDKTDEWIKQNLAGDDEESAPEEEPAAIKPKTKKSAKNKAPAAKEEAPAAEEEEDDDVALPKTNNNSEEVNHLRYEDMADFIKIDYPKFPKDEFVQNGDNVMAGGSRIDDALSDALDKPELANFCKVNDIPLIYAILSGIEDIEDLLSEQEIEMLSDAKILLEDFDESLPAEVEEEAPAEVEEEAPAEVEEEAPAEVEEEAPAEVEEEPTVENNLEDDEMSESLASAVEGLLVEQAGQEVFDLFIAHKREVLLGLPNEFDQYAKAMLPEEFHKPLDDAGITTFYALLTFIEGFDQLEYSKGQTEKVIAAYHKMVELQSGISESSNIASEIVLPSVVTPEEERQYASLVKEVLRKMLTNPEFLSRCGKSVRWSDLANEVYDDAIELATNKDLAEKFINLTNSKRDSIFRIVVPADVVVLSK